ncbi:branched-chain amino acid ABC transporter permease [Herbaspirillum sp. GCM10030257]|uniref:branched-chain amino acid ABC transporter permease n=1 Tax=Herbaspirillum sp. GCM10030257 TaxID=3273393 RepID=UPI00361E44FC
MTATKTLLIAFGVTLALLAVGLVAPKWLLFLVTMAASHGLAILGVVVLSRGGGATFGQGLFFAIGAYVAALVSLRLGINDAILRALLGALAGAVVAGLVAPLLARYRGIFFAMLTLALSMVAYGILSKWTALGGTDGFNLPRPTLLGMQLATEHADYVLYALTVVFSMIASLCIAVYFRSSSGLISLAVRSNDLRVEYLGASSRASLAIDFTLAGALGGLGGALTGLALGHVDPQFAYWTTSGEFVFAAILAGYQSVAAVFVASLVLEVVRSFSNLYFPTTWQLALGIFLLVVVLFRPAGIGSFWIRQRRAPQSSVPDETAPAVEVKPVSHQGAAT